MKEEQINAGDGQTNFVSLNDFRLFVRDSLEAKVRALGIAFINDLLNEEIEQLCGPAGSHKKRRGLAHRGGSELGWVVMNNQRVQIRRPRARKDGAEGDCPFPGASEMSRRAWPQGPGGFRLVMRRSLCPVQETTWGELKAAYSGCHK